MNEASFPQEGMNIDAIFRAGRKGEIYRCVIDTAEKILIEKALERSMGEQLTAAELLGINRNTLRKKIKEYDIRLRNSKSGKG